MSIAIYPGSFDPITLAHEDVFQQAKQVFEKVWLVIAKNDSKGGMFGFEKRLDMALAVLDHSDVMVAEPGSCVIDWANRTGARHVVRGVRSGEDVFAEQTYKRFVEGVSFETINTVYFMSPPNLQHVSSSAVRQILALKSRNALVGWLSPTVARIALGQS